jgi:cytochrome P450
MERQTIMDGAPVPHVLPRVTHGRGGRDFATGGHCGRWLPSEETRPAMPVVMPDGSGALLISRYDEAAEAFTSPRASRACLDARQRLRGPGMRVSMASMDPPAHRSARGLVNGAFSARQIGQLRPAVERTADRLIDTMVARGAPADLLRQFCRPLAFAAHFDVLGVPADHRRRLGAWSSLRSARPGITASEVFGAEQRLHASIRRMLNDTTVEPTGLLAELVRDGLSPERVGAVLTSLLFDGPVLAGTQLANSLMGLFTDTEQLKLLRDDPGLDAGAAEELLRYLPPANTGLPRLTTGALTLGAVAVPAGTVVIVALPPANRDATQFAEPDRLDVTRRGPGHLTFGRGVHYCLGAHLTRVLLTVAFDRLLRRLPGLRLSVPEEDLRWYDAQNIRGVSALPVTW